MLGRVAVTGDRQRAGVAPVLGLVDEGAWRCFSARAPGCPSGWRSVRTSDESGLVYVQRRTGKNARQEGH